MKKKYSHSLPQRMYEYFKGYSESVGAPSFSKFAVSCGRSLAELAAYRENAEFDAAWRECNEIRRDYLIDQALSKRHDASFTKFIYALEYPEDSRSDSEMHLTLEVLDEA